MADVVTHWRNGIGQPFFNEYEEYNGIACRFLTIDADIEHNPNVTEFYIKNGFVPNERLNNKNRVTVSMRKDIFVDETA